MCELDEGNMTERENKIFYEDGRFYFSKKMERRFYFFLTVIMVVFGILSKTGLF